MPQDLAAAARVTAWLVSQGGRIHPNLDVGLDTYGGYGLFTRAKTEPGESHEFNVAVKLEKEASIPADAELFCIPRECMLECPLEVKEPVLQIPALALALIREASLGESSCFAPFIAILPSLEELGGFMLLMRSRGSAPERDSCEGSAEGVVVNGINDELYLLQLALAASPALSQRYNIQQDLIENEYESAVPRLLEEVPSLRFLPDSVQVEQSGSPGEPPSCRALNSMDISGLSSTDGYHEPPTCVGIPGASMEVAHGHHMPPIELYRWARSIVTSRAIHLWQGPTMVPVADFLNHQHPPSVVCMVRTEGDTRKGESSQQPRRRRRITGLSYSSDDSIWLEDSDDSGDEDPGEQPTVPAKQSFCGFAIHDIKQGQEVFWTYNSHNNDADWLLGYGFIPSDWKTSHPETTRSSSASKESAAAFLGLEGRGQHLGWMAALSTFISREYDAGFVQQLDADRASVEGVNASLGDITGFPEAIL